MPMKTKLIKDKYSGKGRAGRLKDIIIRWIMIKGKQDLTDKVDNLL